MTRNRSSGMGEQEWELYQFIASGATNGVTVGEAAEAFGGPRGLSRSTVVTMMERLRAKNYLMRAKAESDDSIGAGVFRYRPAQQTGDVQGGLIARFVEKTLSGSLTPLVAYFANAQKLTDSEMTELSRLLAKLDDGSNPKSQTFNESAGETRDDK